MHAQAIKKPANKLFLLGDWLVTSRHHSTMKGAWEREKSSKIQELRDVRAKIFQSIEFF